MTPERLEQHLQVAMAARLIFPAEAEMLRREHAAAQELFGRRWSKPPVEGLEPLECKGCKQTFTPVRRRQTFCAKKCRQKLSELQRSRKRAAQRRHAQSVAPRKCEKCGELYEPVRLNQLYCSVKCRFSTQAARERNRQKCLARYYRRKARRQSHGAEGSSSSEEGVPQGSDPHGGGDSRPAAA